MIIDVTRLVGRYLKGKLPTGIDRVCLAYVERYGQKSCALIRIRSYYHIAPHELSQNIFAALLSGEAKKHQLIGWIVGSLFSLKRCPTKGAIMFNLGHMGIDRDDYPYFVKKAEVRPVYMVHDLIPIAYPEYSRIGEKERHQKRINCVLDTAYAIVTNSQATLDELGQYAKSQSKPLPQSTWALLGTLTFAQRDLVTPLASPYFVILGTIEGRKNHLLLLNIWRKMVDRLGERTPYLIVIGQRGWECENVIDMLDRCDKLKKYVIEIPRCSDLLLASYLRYTQALLFPSFTEGYGMPLAEALGGGVPVIASNLPVFQEIAQEIPEYLDPLDAKGWEEMIIEFARPHSTKRHEQIERMKHFVSPTWESHFERVGKLLGI